MLPEVRLRDVTRSDVERIAGWLADQEVSSRWFGHYACGDPVHRGYDPAMLLRGSDAHWERTFRLQRSRQIFSIYTSGEEHIGESQVIFDDRGGAEISLLIGRRDLWHHGYGTATVIDLMEHVFSSTRVDRAWVNVPEDNVAALGLFKKLGFAHRETRELCTRPDGTALQSCILTISIREFMARQTWTGVPPRLPVVAITGMPWSGSRVIGAEVARMIGGRFIDREIDEKICERLNLTIGEVRGPQANYESVWGRMFQAVLKPYERWETFGASYDWIGSWPMAEHEAPPEDLTKEKYLETLRMIVSQFAAEGGAVLHGHGGHLALPAKVDAVHVLVRAPDEMRFRRILSDQRLTPQEAMRRIRKADRAVRSACKSLWGFDPDDLGNYDLVINSGPMSSHSAARTIVASAVDERIAGRLDLPVDALRKSYELWTSVRSDVVRSRTERPREPDPSKFRALR